jgi:hypothetical protein
MKINKVIFGVDDNPLYGDFWPIQAKLVKEVLGAEPVLFHITNKSSDFYNDGHGLVKKIDKDTCPGIITSFISQVVRMYATKYFPDEICMPSDIDMLILNKEWFTEQIKDISDNDLVIMDSKAYDLERPECRAHNESCENRYPICYNIAKGSTFNKILNTDRPFSQYVYELSLLKLGWGTDELYFGDQIHTKNHGINIIKLIRNYTTPWAAERRINRDILYDKNHLKTGYYIDFHCPRPYSDYKIEINKIINTSKKYV